MTDLAQSPALDVTASYDPADDKIRLRPSQRLDSETYARVKAVGYAWAPKQGCFYAVWSPAREDVALELAGDIGDEDTSLVERAEERAERFEGYRGKRAAEAHSAREAVDGLANGIPLGQPILVGHRSQRRAEKDAERIKAGMRKAVKLWETSTYWADRAAGAIRHAQYKELPAVRARRIKKLEADKRKCERDLKASEMYATLWRSLVDAERIRSLVERCIGCTWELGQQLKMGEVTPEAARDLVVGDFETSAASERRWIAHLENRLVYERAMLGESGYVEPAKTKSIKANAPLLNIRGTVEYWDRWAKEVRSAETHAMTKAEFAAIHDDMKGTELSGDKTHRLRTAVIGHKHVIVFLTDSKEHARPTAEVVAQAKEDEEVRVEVAAAAKAEEARRYLAEKPARDAARAAKEAEAAPFKQLKQAARDGVVAVSAPQLFPTPTALAKRMVELADIKPEYRVLEPSAGTGNIVRAILDAAPEAFCIAVEVEPNLVRHLRAIRGGALAVRDDFLHVDANDVGLFERVVMNPPFERGSDIAHILHARKFLQPGGRLVAICANGPRQQAELRPLASMWEELPDDTFAAEGTRVRTVLLTIDT